MTDTIPEAAIEAMLEQFQCASSRELRAALKAAEQAGYKLVPVEPTEAMVLATAPVLVEAWKHEEWASEEHSLVADLGPVYRAMIAASPKVG